jgi:2-keto-4-pentenoate hydratase/2-oxohepta-3-ene-1,7-dioic acid hydratase in catechol pathway
MAINLARFPTDSGPRWGVVQRNGIVPLSGDYPTTAALIEQGANIAPGDVLLTGTPSGCALRVPPPMIRRFLQLLPERKFWELFVSSQRQRPEYLKPGDIITATIRGADGGLDLGEQRITVA